MLKISSTRTSIKQKFQRKYLVVNGQAKYNLFGHWCFMRFSLVILAISFFLTNVRSIVG